MVDETTRPMDSYLMDCVNNKEWPMACDLINATDLAHAVNTAPGFKGINPIALTQTMKRLGYANLGAKRMMGKKIKLWAVRNFKTWITAGESEIATHYEAPPQFDQRNLDF